MKMEYVTFHIQGSIIQFQQKKNDGESMKNKLKYRTEK